MDRPSKPARTIANRRPVVSINTLRTKTTDVILPHFHLLKDSFCMYNYLNRSSMYDELGVPAKCLSSNLQRLVQFSGVRLRSTRTDAAAHTTAVFIFSPPAASILNSMCGRLQHLRENAASRRTGVGRREARRAKQRQSRKEAVH